MDKVDYEAKLATEVAKLKEYQSALEAEYAAFQKAEQDKSEGKLDAATVYAQAEQKLLAAVDQATDQVIHLLTFAEKDATQFAVAKYIIDAAKVKGGPEAKDPMQELLDKLTANDATAHSEAEDAVDQ